MLHAKTIKLQIDSDDLLKILDGFMNSATVKKFTDQMMQRTAFKFGTYSNPYHPEDTVNNVDVENARNAAIEAKLEKANANFLSDSGELSEDELDENPSDGINLRENTRVPAKRASPGTKPRKPVNYDKNTFFTVAQRRFKLKSSI